MDSVNLGPILFKRLHIEGSTLRSQSLEYQADLIEGYILKLLLLITPNFTPYLVVSRFRSEVLSKITGEGGRGPIRTYIYKASNLDLV